MPGCGYGAYMCGGGGRARYWSGCGGCIVAMAGPGGGATACVMGGICCGSGALVASVASAGSSSLLMVRVRCVGGCGSGGLWEEGDVQVQVQKVGCAATKTLTRLGAQREGITGISGRRNLHAVLAYLCIVHWAVDSTSLAAIVGPAEGVAAVAAAGVAAPAWSAATARSAGETDTWCAGRSRVVVQAMMARRSSTDRQTVEWCSSRRTGKGAGRPRGGL